MHSACQAVPSLPCTKLSQRRAPAQYTLSANILDLILQMLHFIQKQGELTLPCTVHLRLGYIDAEEKVIMFSAQADTPPCCSPCGKLSISYSWSGHQLCLKIIKIKDVPAKYSRAGIYIRYKNWKIIHINLDTKTLDIMMTKL